MQLPHGLFIIIVMSASKLGQFMGNCMPSWNVTLLSNIFHGFRLLNLSFSLLPNELRQSFTRIYHTLAISFLFSWFSYKILFSSKLIAEPFFFVFVLILFHFSRHSFLSNIVGESLPLRFFDRRQNYSPTFCFCFNPLSFLLARFSKQPR